MNIVTALFLVYLPEEAAFSLLQSVCETLMPGYYNRGMVGTMVDVQLFGDLIDSELPDIGQHLRSLSVPIPAITMPWLLCLYIGYVPMEISLRVLDAFFCEGLDVLFRVGLAILRLQREELLAIDETYAIMVLLKRGLNLGDELLAVPVFSFFIFLLNFELVFGEYSRLSIDTLREKKSQEHKSAAVRLLQDDTRQTKVNDLKMRNSTLCTWKKTILHFLTLQCLKKNFRLYLSIFPIFRMILNFFSRLNNYHRYLKNFAHSGARLLEVRGGTGWSILYGRFYDFSFRLHSCFLFLLLRLRSFFFPRFSAVSLTLSLARSHPPPLHLSLLCLCCFSQSLLSFSLSHSPSLSPLTMFAIRSFALKSVFYSRKTGQCIDY